MTAVFTIQGNIQQSLWPQ